MAFEKLAPYLEQIEEGFRNKQSPRAVAAAIGQPSLYSTIDRYKRAIWNFNDLVSEAKEVRAVKHEEAREAMVQEIVDTLDTLNLAKFRARQLLRLELGDEYTLADGSIRKVSWQTAANLWQVGQRMICDVNKAELELGGDDPESRKAQALESWDDTRLAIVEALDENQEAKERVIEALEKIR
jgi:hypothetical protein